jgi:hypothetical protein
MHGTRHTSVSQHVGLLCCVVVKPLNLHQVMLCSGEATQPAPHEFMATLNMVDLCTHTNH